MAVSALAIDILRPLPRNQGVQIPGLLPAPRWVDGRALAANVAESYTFPTDSAGVIGRVFRITTDAALWINFHGTAAITASDITDGTASIRLLSHLEPSLIVAPVGATLVSMIAAATCIVSIEVWA